jgi:hypothetical protein
VIDLLGRRLFRKLAIGIGRTSNRVQLRGLPRLMDRSRPSFQGVA